MRSTARKTYQTLEATNANSFTVPSAMHAFLLGSCGSLPARVAMPARMCPTAITKSMKVLEGRKETSMQCRTKSSHVG